MLKFLVHALPFTMVYGVVWGVAGMALPLLAGSTNRAGLVFAMLNLGVAIGAPVWGHLSRKQPVAGLIFLSTLLAGGGWIVLSFLGNDFLPLTAFAFGLFSAGAFALATVQVTRIFPREKWDSYIADMQSMMVVGQVIGLLATSLYTGPALGIPFLLVGLVSAAWMARGLIQQEKLNFTHRHWRLHQSQSLLPGVLHGHHLRQIRFQAFLTLRSAYLAMILTRWTLLILAWAPIFALYPLLMRHAFGFGEAPSSLIYSGSTALSVPLFLMAGWIARRISSVVSVTLGALVSAVSFVLMYGAVVQSNGALGAAGFVVMSCAYAFVAVGMNDGVVDAVSSEKEGDALGVANALMSLDNVLGGIAGGALVALFSYNVLFWIGFGLSVMALVLGLISATLRRAALVQETSA
ncbi:MFS transporter [Acidocella aminolytica]|uniref:Major facilitator superfamily (MFS) profile domain-containing protein n=1 Tax=Acidocella aminolytica 101 = DSM 11237 TaxID=1120923 RepID=A0A0D6PK79_9PROT|nr:MFS transporter [Acidocella aminolytica]GAN81598.1 hypothetical protein Aam_106_006 [Acidocella aminolytica 101 = DSM 11237]GBQ40791.1 hypothetical protein AA11237_2480 [Acidocella aminolytica 101 = DSM 11237]SHF26691.1 Predicted arabinose efflux permease, MFS family [Acidocella aminolytica 101 = DSM 11237]